MKATFSLSDADEREATLSVTMTVKNWKMLLEQWALRGQNEMTEWPSSEMYERIQDMVRKVTDNYAQSMSGEL